MIDDTDDDEYEDDIYDPVDERDRAVGGRQAVKPAKLSEGLFLGSNPTRSKRYDEDEIGAHRRVLCRRYVNCISFAAAQDWLGWTCNNCDVRDNISREQQVDDLEWLSEFLYELDLVRKRRR